ncbi:6-phosphogluconolactonase [Chitinophaga terrae (ex Kim and Jung 2007)]|uniref:6-phosphogluconolactonase n=1 Tax=Chitinophaga terrae (ex Kim and Jung 2007) TaxID=408074 RepID=A0A1H4FI52_9BACT|nr:6-phosphogluconolactonase [Chitinophaga terrae (ex Kim and Jung 2007)]MDQ0105837.1 6-phosphogluconolactonase [Chitinophaga terrae (ex Kim and Jung 2007)]GEP92501.1 6-phosphogluconolactonase [Chitinophaga terrae (ex Kim and Jung 2007)]SEA97029.1 6-phosphogluconolactonase [Chitinophaga terrae (ex Kim and Jung 2007)]
MELHIAKDAAQLSENVAAWISNYILEVLQRQERFTFVLSGGNTPKQLYALLAKAPYNQIIPWERIHFFWGDERAVPFEDERNNAKMAFDTLLDKVSVNPDNIHVMRTDISPDASAAEYEKTLKTYFGKEQVTFDLVLLGMGDDGHTLSLFPGLPIVHEQKAWVKAFWLEAQDMYRITLTAPVVNNSACVLFMATGAGKAITLKNVIEGTFDAEKFPSQLIRPQNGQLHWFVDEAAAGALEI